MTWLWHGLFVFMAGVTVLLVVIPEDWWEANR